MLDILDVPGNLKKKISQTPKEKGFRGNWVSKEIWDIACNLKEMNTSIWSVMCSNYYSYTYV